jgi:hypothetical protein
MSSKKIISITTGLALAASMALAIPAFAQVNGQGDGNKSGGYGQSNASLQGQIKGAWTGQMGGTNRGSGMPGSSGTMKPGVFGTVTAVNGNAITINGRQGFGPTATATTTYTVDATNATVKKNNAASTVSAIAVGDMIFAQGTITGTNVVATSIRDGVMMGTRGQGGPGMNGKGGQGHATSTPPVSPFTGNGQPVIAGKVSAISGDTLTVTTTSNVTYSVDATNAKILEGQNTIAIGSIVVGNTVLVQGTVNGTSITASTVVDQSGPAASVTANMDKGQKYGFFGGIGQFFMHLFGF